MTKQNQIICAHLREDPRTGGRPLAEVGIFSSKLYELTLVVLPGVASSPGFQNELIVVAALYKQEGVTAVAKLHSEKISGDYAAYVKKVFLPQLSSQGTTPLELVARVKRWAGLPFTAADRAELLPAGVDVS